jgi:crotonobetainyl-CoA:carnitine CoA-transferase CaiB-like acyl-CoA transferase
MVGSPIRLDGDRADSDLPPPALGEHTSEILERIGVSSEERRAMCAKGIIGG